MSETKMKVFTAATREDAEEKARVWWNEQIGFIQTLSPAAEQSDNGWVVTIYFREQLPKSAAGAQGQTNPAGSGPSRARHRSSPWQIIQRTAFALQHEQERK